MGGKIGKSRQQYTITAQADPAAEVEVETIDAAHGRGSMLLYSRRD